jgi:succinyl-diaminopimelate desuccinylase
MATATSAVIENGWLFGRGTADSKAAVAIFAHIAARLREQASELHGTLTLLYDADEHTGRFGGAKQYFTGPDAPADVADLAGVMIGYPGLSKVVIGGRGFLRAKLTVRAEAGHSGGSHEPEGGNAIEKAAVLIRALMRHRLPAPLDPDLGLPANLSVTEVRGGQGYTVIPDRCELLVDVRLTRTFDAGAALRLLESTVATVDRRKPTARATSVTYEESWPAYRLHNSAPVRLALVQAGAQQLPDAPQPKVAGPSNIGCYLASLDIDATAGFGVAYRGLHGTDERIELSTIPPVQATYPSGRPQPAGQAVGSAGPPARNPGDAAVLGAAGCLGQASVGTGRRLDRPKGRPSEGVEDGDVDASDNARACACGSFSPASGGGVWWACEDLNLGPLPHQIPR